VFLGEEELQGKYAIYRALPITKEEYGIKILEG
jgi:hypothetical protein